MVNDSSKSTGLVSLVSERLQSALCILASRWLDEPAADLQRVVRMTDAGSSSITIEPYQGTQSLLTFRKQVADEKILDSLERAIHEHQPALLGWVKHSHENTRIQDVFALTAALLREVLRQRKAADSFDNAVAYVIAQLDELLETGCATRETVTALSGLQLPDETDQIQIEDDLQLRRLTTEEMSNIRSGDVVWDVPSDMPHRFVTTAIVQTRAENVSVTAAHVEFNPDFAAALYQQEQMARVLAALHILKTGGVCLEASYITIHPAILPGMSGLRSVWRVVNPFSFMELTVNDVERFVEIHKSLAANRRDAIEIATLRLHDAETRTSPVDALLDAVIGLEVLLNPNDRSELAFRVALNYAFLGNENERRYRYENVRDIQVTRNRLVHGGINLKSKDAAKIHEDAALAKFCLRDTIVKFLTDQSLSGNKKLDADFWLDRVLPPTAS